MALKTLIAVLLGYLLTVWCEWSEWSEWVCLESKVSSDKL